MVLERRSILLDIKECMKKQYIKKAYTDKYTTRIVGSINLKINVFVAKPTHYNQPINCYEVIKPNSKIDLLEISKAVTEALIKTAFDRKEQIIKLETNKNYGDPAIEVIVEKLG